MKKYILFDNDGVLVETEPLYYKASKKVLKDYFDISLEFNEYMKIMAEGTTVWQQALKKGFSQTKINNAREQRNIYYQKYLKNENITINAVHKVLEKLSLKYKMAIVTTSRRVDFEIIHKNRGIIEFMDFILCEEDYQFAKPHPEPYLKALKLFNAKKQDAIVVEDSQRGLTSAHTAGIDCIVVHNEFTKTQNFSKATFKINQLNDLLDIL